MSKRKKPTRYEGIIGIGDRVAFYMPGERWITAGEVEDISLDQQTLTICKLAGCDADTAKRITSKPTVMGGTVKGTTALTMLVQRGLVVENKSEVRREEKREMDRAKARQKGSR